MPPPVEGNIYTFICILHKAAIPFPFRRRHALFRPWSTFCDVLWRSLLQRGNGSNFRVTDILAPHADVSTWDVSAIPHMSDVVAILLKNSPPFS